MMGIRIKTDFVAIPEYEDARYVPMKMATP
jgi:hypothetical protein